MNGLFWNDFRSIPNCGTSVQSESQAQAAGMAVRMDSAIAAGKRVLLAIHTCPWRELNGHPLRGDEADILSAYSGNSLVGKEIEKRAASVDFLMCGHTHMPVRERLCCGIPSLNVGADYGLFRGVIYESESKVIRWIGGRLKTEYFAPVLWLIKNSIAGHPSGSSFHAMPDIKKALCLFKSADSGGLCLLE